MTDQLSPDMTLGAWFDWWIENHVEKTMSLSATRNAQAAANLHFGPLIGDIPLSRLMPGDVQHAINTLEDTYAPSTIRLSFDVLGRGAEDREGLQPG